MKTNAKKTAAMGVLLALALILGWVEHMIPLSAAVPGIKLGLANIVVVFAMYRLGKLPSLTLSASKVLLSAVLFGGLSGMLYSACGAALSFIVMLPLCRCGQVSPIGVSAVGGAAHVAAQIAVAVLLTSTPQIWRFLPVLLITGTLTGALTGFAAALVMRRVNFEPEVTGDAG